ncbi:MAG: sigma-70 family RNA polymerase sigma factor [Verrucomicrobiaceae bacterium]|nr:MAG: sigma-70 family RNA polymerase sigma factor [Verrucomicrobiaceae bacterium]
MSGFPENVPKLSALPDVDPSDGAQTAPEKPMAETREQFVEKALADFESPLIGYAVTILHDLDRARDVVQDTFIRLCQQEPDKIRESLKTWLFTVCRNRAFDILRKDKRVQPLDEVQWKRVAGPELAPDEQADHDERIAQVMKSLDKLSANQREVILLKFQQGLSYQEIVEVTGLTSGNIGFLIHTGLKRLRDSLPADFRS